MASPRCRITSALGLAVLLLTVGRAHAQEHGLLGHYFTPVDAAKTYPLRPVDAYGVPLPPGPGAATRIDPQVAFGKGKGFVADPSRGGQVVWWEPAGATAVVWQGYLRLPKTGTYYVTTASSGASAVYLNQARVCLNGQFGGYVPSPEFTLGDSGAGEPYHADQAQYVVPVVATAGAELPIDLRYMRHDSSGHLRGVDLYWVTPDARADAQGRKIAELVPTDALRPAVPRQATAAPAAGASGPHCTMTCDRAYVTLGRHKEVAVMVHVADGAGHPLAGKRVHLSTLATYGHRDAAVQPDSPTDNQGVTTGRVQFDPGGVGHVATVFATVLGDCVDVSNACEIVVEQARDTVQFLPDGYSPYYDGQAFRIDPLPLQVGRPATFSTELENRQKVPALVSAQLSALPWNIGVKDWPTIGQSDRVLLQPGERRPVSITWTPVAESPHQCFRVAVVGWLMDQKARSGAEATSARPAEAGLLPLAQAPQPRPVPTATPPGEPTQFEMRQRNIGPVQRCPPPDPSDATQFGLPGNNKLGSPYGVTRVYRKDGTAHKVDPDYKLNPETDLPSTPDKPNPRVHKGNDYLSHNRKGEPTPVPFTSPVYGKVTVLGGTFNIIRVTTCDGWQVEFLHASKVSVKSGQDVGPGTQLGVTGETGAAGAGIHLHVQVRDKDGKPVDPNTTGPLANRPRCDPKGLCLEDEDSPKDYGRRTGPDFRQLADEAYEYAMSHRGKLDGNQMVKLLGMYTRYDDLAKASDALAADPPDAHYQTLAAPQHETPADYIGAITRSWERLQGAKAADDREWTRRHLTALKAYERRLAELHRAALQQVQTGIPAAGADFREDAQAALQARAQFRQHLRTEGLGESDLSVSRQAAIDDVAVRRTARSLMEYGVPDDLGQPNPDLPLFESYGAVLRAMAETEAQAADVAQGLSDERPSARQPGETLGEFTQTFTVSNPEPQRREVALTFRRLALPASWTLQLLRPRPTSAATVAAHDHDAEAPGGGPELKEQEAGKAYSIVLDPGQQVRLTSALIPVGPAGEDTSARWAVEGRIDGKLIGGIVQEMYVPATVEGLRLPAVGTPDTVTAATLAAGTPAAAPPTAASAPAGPGAARWLWPVLAVLAAAVVAAVVVTGRRRRGA
jgi:hypothetical protein